MAQGIELRPEEIASREQVGWYRGAPVFLVQTSGGYSMVFCIKNGQPEMLGVGPHPGVAKGIARKVEPRIVYTELQKSTGTDEGGRIFQRYLALTRAVRAERYGR